MEKVDKACDRVIRFNKDIVTRYKNGEAGLFNHLVGKVVRKSKGTLGMTLVSNRLKIKLTGCKK